MELESVSLEPTSEPSEVSDSPSSGADAGEPKSSSTPAPKSYKIKVDGGEHELTEEDLIKFAQIGKAKDRRFEEAAKARKDAEQLRDKYKKDWVAALKENGIDPRQATEEWLAEQLRLEMMSPEAKQQWERDQKLQHYEKMEKEREAEQQRQQYQAEVQKHEQALDQEIVQALSSVAVPKTPGSIYRMANYMLAGYDAAEAAQAVEQDYQRDIAELLGSVKDLNKYLPQDAAKKLMDGHLQKVKGAPSYANSTEGTPTTATRKEERLSPSEFRKLFR